MLFFLILFLPSVNADATMGNVFVFLHSEDFFPGNSHDVGLYCRDFTACGHDALLAERPTIVYGMQQNLKNAESLFVCCHGKDEGSVLLIDIVGTKEILFRTTDVPKNMDCKLAYLGACRSAQSNTTTGKNLCSTLVSNGYKTVIGYNADVKNPLAIAFEESFFDYFAKGKSVYVSINETIDYLEYLDADKYKEIISAVSKFGDLGVTAE